MLRFFVGKRLALEPDSYFYDGFKDASKSVSGPIERKGFEDPRGQGFE
jgi:hypothetical protein